MSTSQPFTSLELLKHPNFPCASSLHSHAPSLLITSTPIQRKPPRKKLVVQFSADGEPAKKNGTNMEASNNQPQAPSPTPPQGKNQWVKWGVSSVVFLALPAWKKIQVVQGLITKVDSAVEVVESVVETTEMLVSDMADHLPEGNNMKKVMEKLEKASEEVLEHVRAIDNVVDKVDEIVDKLQVDSKNESVEQKKPAEEVTK